MDPATRPARVQATAAGHPARGRSGVAAGLLARRSMPIPAFPTRKRVS